VTLSTAVVYQPAPGGGPGGFVASKQIALLSNRIAHGAVALANGNTVLVGGSNTMLVPGSDMTGTPLNTVELVTIGQSGSALVAELQDARVSPTVLRLPTGTQLDNGFADNIFDRCARLHHGVALR
jgi:hypothetical protein